MNASKWMKILVRNSSSTTASTAAAGAHCVAQFGTPKASANAPWALPAEQLVTGWHALVHPRAGSGARAYALIGSLALLERALLDHAFDFLYARLQQQQDIGRLELMEVADILPLATTRACGVYQRVGHTPIQYRVFRSASELFQPSKETIPEDVSNSTVQGFCLSGTAEMGIADKLKDRVFDECELPAYFVAQSRCFRPEIAQGQMDRGLYRVHEFDKIEMFVVCTERQSEQELQRLVDLQRELFTSLELHCRILDMPPEELGVSASRKFDTEAWLAGRRAWGELASASNCTDYQAQRLQIRYRPKCDGSELRVAHTCNGTGLASTRALLALLETHQTETHKRVILPEVIRQRMPTEKTPGVRFHRAPSIKYNFEN